MNLQVFGEKTSDAHVGDYTIEIKARIFNETFSLVQTESFTLTVWKKEEKPIIDPIFPIASCAADSDSQMQISVSVQAKPLSDGMDIIEVSAKFADLQPNGWYTFSLIDNTGPKCQGTKLMDLGRVFADRNRHGFIQKDINGISLNGSNSALGNYLLLSNRIGEQACCQIVGGTPLKLSVSLQANVTRFDDPNIGRIVTSTPTQPIIRLDLDTDLTIELGQKQEQEIE